MFLHEFIRLVYIRKSTWLEWRQWT